ncbi:hypothetical protein RI065_05850 [Mycoplasmatota bacterium zrk1]
MHTKKTFLIKSTDLFDASINSVVSVVEFLVLGIIVIGPYLLILGVIYLPVRFIYKRFRK